MDEANMKYLL